MNPIDVMKLPLSIRPFYAIKREVSGLISSSNPGQGGQHGLVHYETSTIKRGSSHNYYEA